jgi:hypothetical protein
MRSQVDRFTFTGLSAFHGTIDSLSAGAISTYAIDGNTAVPVVAPSVVGNNYNQSLCVFLASLSNLPQTNGLFSTVGTPRMDNS